MGAQNNKTMALQRITCEGASGVTIAHVCDPCGKELGRVRGVILFRGDYDVESLIAKLKLGTPEGNQQAVAQFEAAIESGDAHLISETTGTYDGGAPQEGDGYGDEEKRLLGFLHTLTFKDPSYAGNVEFYENVEKEHYKVVWRTESLLHFGDQPASIQATDPVEEDLTSAVVWNVTASWKSKNKAKVAPLEALKKYFEGCWAQGSGSGSGSAQG